MIPARALFVAFLSTLLSFAVFLLVALVGMVIFACGIERARELMQPDPIVASGVFGCEFVPWYS